MNHTKKSWGDIFTNDRSITVRFDHLSDSLSDSEYKEIQSNVAIIATAPEMLEVLQKALLVLNSFDSTNASEACITNIESVLKKVKGI